MLPAHIAVPITLAVFAVFSALQPAGAADTWRGLRIAPEHRCAPFDRAAYPYPQSIERAIIRRLGGRIYGPYTGRHFTNPRQTDIEHIVAVSEAHDSGLCAADRATRIRFAQDLLNLTLAAPAINRCGAGGKCGHDAAEWLPPRNRCWYAARIIDVRKKYGLTIDPREAQVLDRVLADCPVRKMVLYPPSGETTPTPAPASTQTEPVEALAQWDDNDDGRITCAEARRHGIAPVRRGHAAYRFMVDGDGDGTVCE